MMRIYKFALVFAVAAFFGCCTPETPVGPDPVPVPATHVFLMYDNIGDWFVDDEKEAAKAVASGALGTDERVVVFRRQPAGHVIYELVKDGSQAAGFSRKILKQYAKGENATLSKETIASVVGDVRKLVPAPHYGLAFGSHGMGWVPKSSKVAIARHGAGDLPYEHPFAELWAERENPLTRYLAYNSSEKIDISEFADALDEWDWDFILLDDCFMASVEALYEMRHLADYFIASATEIWYTGFPYDKVVTSLFSDWDDLGTVAGEYVNYYRFNVSPYATVSVVKSSELEALALAVRNLRQGGGFDDALNPETVGIQFYELISTPSHVFYDLDDYISHATSNTALYNMFSAQLVRTVTFAGHTDRFYSDAFLSKGQVPVTHFSGLSVFIPWSRTSSLMPYYRQTEWYKTVYEE